MTTLKEKLLVWVQDFVQREQTRFRIEEETNNILEGINNELIELRNELRVEHEFNRQLTSLLIAQDAWFNAAGGEQLRETRQELNNARKRVLAAAVVALRKV